jgi:hypothetical protein
MQSIELGRTYKDKITGFTGVATGYVHYISGCNQALLAPPVGADGKMPEGQWFDEQRLEAQANERIVLENSLGNGFDREPPKR